MGDLIKLGASYNRTVLMTDSADHVTGKTGLTLVVTLSKNGAAFASISPTVTELSAGRYKISLTAAHTDTLGPIDLQITATGADPSDTHDQVVAFDPSDAAALGLTTITAIAGYVDTEVAAINTGVNAIKAKTDNLPDSPAAAGDAMTLTTAGYNAAADALLDRANGVEASVTFRQALRAYLSALSGKREYNQTTKVLSFLRRDGATVAFSLTIDAEGGIDVSTIGTL